MAIDRFNDMDPLINVRTKSLVPVIDKVNELDPKVKGLQDVVALTLTQPEVIVKDKKITFKKGDTGITQELDLGPMFDDYKHGIDISGDMGATVTNAEKVKFKRGKISQSGDVVEVDVGGSISGQVGSGVVKDIQRLIVTGNTDGSSLDSNGTMTLNMPNNSIGAILNGSPISRVDKIQVVDSVAGSEISGDTFVVRMPKPIKGSLVGGTPEDLKSIKFIGNTGRSTEGGGDMIIDLPMMEGVVGDIDPTLEHITGIRVKGNTGGSKIENNILEIDLPAAGSGGSSDLKVGVLNYQPVSNVGEIWFQDSEVKVDQTTKSASKVLVTHKGTPVEIEGKSPPGTGNVKQIKLTGDVETCDISSTGLLTLNIPHHAGLTVTDGGSISSTGITTLEFADSTVDIASTGSPKATITPNGVSGIMSGKTEPVKSIEIIGTLGTSTLADGKLKIDLPAGGGGTGGADITGVVGSDSAKIERIEVIGAKYNSSVDGTTKALKIDIPRKVAIKGGSDTYSDIDTVEVANSIVQLDETGGGRKAFITPQIPFMFYGWFRDMESLNLAIPMSGRIPTKSCGYVMDPVTHQNTLMMWMPGVGGVNDWAPIPVTGSLTFMRKGIPVNKALSVEENPMVSVSNQGVLTITDTTVPEVVCETLNDASTAVQKGIFNKVQFIDGDGAVDFEPDQKLLKILRAQRRINMGNDPDVTTPQFTDDKYEGSIFLNNDDKSWWGFSNRAHTKKWTKVLHSGMSGEVTDLVSRVPPKIATVKDTPLGDDNLLWNLSGWSHMERDNSSLPAEVHQKTGGFVQTFVYKNEHNLDEKMQVLHLDQDAASYKRYFDTSTRRWKPWVKISFNPLELKTHNEDLHAHRISHPYYKTVTFDCDYADIKTNNYYLPIKAMHVLGSSDGRHKINEDQISTVAYDGNYRVRGHLYFRGDSTAAIAKDRGVWKLYLEKREKGTNPWVNIKTIEYQHNTTSMAYPPLRWDITDVPLKSGDSLSICLKFEPASMSEDAWLALQKGIGFYGLRSFISVDEQDNDGGFALGETHRKLHGRFVAIGDYGLKVFRDIGGTTTRVVDDTINTSSTEMKE